MYPSHPIFMHYLPTIHSGCQIVVLALEHRIRLVKEKASYSEKAVLEIRI
jgi:hypothetical protein